jgi:tetratricopeptide (TPR) repeat protein
MAPAGNEELTGTGPSAAEREPADVAILDGASGGEETDQQPLAGVAPGLALTPEHEGEASLESFAMLPAEARETHGEIDQFNRLALAKMASGDYPAAIHALRRTLALVPNSAAAHGNLALALWRSKQPILAEIHAQRAVIIDPNYVRAHRTLAELLRERGAPDALGEYRRLLALDPDNFMAHNNAGLVLAGLDRRSEADAEFARALELRPDNPYVRFNQLALWPDGDLVEAADCCRRALQQRPADADTMTNLGVVLQFSGRYDDALSAYERATAIDPQHAKARFNLSLLLLLRGDYPRGLREYEHRWHLGKAKKPRMPRAQWQGEDVAGKTVLLRSEQGLGDTIQFLRYAPMVAERGARVVLRLERPLVRLAASLPGQVAVSPIGSPLPRFDVWSPMLDLPRIFDTRADSIPAHTPYLGARVAIRQRWHKRLENVSGLKAGLVWAGSPTHINDFRRSIDLDRLKPVLAVPGVSFLSLQVGPRAGDVAALPPGTIADLSAELTDLAETAGAILNLDLVVTVDTAVAHLAGALGKPVWVMLPFSPDWRWMIEREDSPWYPTLRLYRQRAPSDWDGVIARVTADLAALAAER